MLSAQLVRAIERNAEELTREVLQDLASNPRTPRYHRLAGDELHRRVYDVYHHLDRWLGDKSDAAVESSYASLGRTRRAEGIPLSEVVYALILVKEHLCRYILRTGAADTAVELYQEEELNLMVARFFDKALYHTVRGYESAATAASATAAPAR